MIDIKVIANKLGVAKYLSYIYGVNKDKFKHKK